ncbi:winged helix-turn-helix transcriptional regulator [Streptomyces sp. NPDC057552]|uniref:winged helix-turn-helix transcriptional regulator n=1 Tax=Streptomyces sp. NPDC057552 TaxID=3350537 RepID=UPI0036A1901B
MSAAILARTRSAPTAPVWERRPLSGRSRRLLLEGDVEGRYAGRDDADAGYRITMALALACSQPGREWSPADFHQALIYAPTRGGWWARKLRERKGTLYAEGKLTAMLDKARDFAARNGSITGRGDALVQITEVRHAVEHLAWKARGGGAVDQKNLAVRLNLCERAGGLEHTTALRPHAERMGCAKSTAEASDKRLVEDGWLELLEAGTGKNHGSRWRLKIPEPVRELLARAGPGHSLPPTTPELATVPDPHTFTDTVALASVMAHDAFHHYGHGTSGARILTCLDVTEGLSPAQLQQATALHRTTVARRLDKLVADGLVRELEGLYYLVADLAGPARLQPDEHLLDQAAEQQGTTGLGERRRQRHARDRANYQRWIAERATRSRPVRPRPVLVPEGVVDPDTGELLDEGWRGWDTSDPFRPTWLAPGAVPVPNEPFDTVEAACA